MLNQVNLQNYAKDLQYLKQTVLGTTIHPLKIFLTSLSRLLSDKGQHRPLFCLFSVFSVKHFNFTTNQCEKCPRSIHRQDSNSQPSYYESPPLTTRPGLPPGKGRVSKELSSNIMKVIRVRIQSFSNFIQDIAFCKLIVYKRKERRCQ